jgi:hypothetical protein
MPRPIILALVIVAALVSIDVSSALAWGSAYEDAVLAGARGALLHVGLAGALDDVQSWEGASSWDEGWSGARQGSPAECVEAATRSLRDALASGDHPRSARAIMRLAHETANLWQPLHAAGTIEHPRLKPGFHFRYATLLGERVEGGWISTSAPRVVQAPRLVAEARVAARSRQVPELVAAEEQANVAAGDRYDDTYFDVLWVELGGDLQQSAEDAAQLVADLVYTAWIEAGRPEVPSTSPAQSGLMVRSIGPNPIRAQAEVRLDLQRAGTVTVDLYDVSGRHVRRLAETWVAAGEQVLAIGGLDINRPASGTYFLRVASRAGSDRRKVTLLY